MTEEKTRQDERKLIIKYLRSSMIPPMWWDAVKWLAKSIQAGDHAPRRPTKMKKKSKKTSKTFERRWHSVNDKKRPRGKMYMSADEVRKAVVTGLSGKFDNTFQIYIADDKYFCPSKPEAAKIIKASSLDRKTWTEERFDCDDFAIVLKGHFAEAAYVEGQRRHAHCFGVVWGMLPHAHAINWFLDDTGKVWFVEPQTDEIYRPRKDDKGIWFMLV